MSKLVIGIVGIIGAGKTMLTEQLGEVMGESRRPKFTRRRVARIQRRGGRKPGSRRFLCGHGQAFFSITSDSFIRLTPLFLTLLFEHRLVY
jgi:ribose 1,5-bisphosphokinase PhnN